MTVRRAILLLWSCVALLRARLTLWRLSDAEVVQKLRASHQEGVGDPAWVRDLAWALPAAAARVPWRSDCLVRSLAASKLLQRQGAPCEFILYAGRREGGAFGAHAVVQSAGLTVTGGLAEDLVRIDIAAPRNAETAIQ